MKGLEISRRYFEVYGRPMLETEFPELLPYLAVGLMGSGSECYGFDDEVSRDHDLEPGFCLFLPGEDVIDRRQAFLLERAYSKLPKEFEGLQRSLMGPVGGSRRGVLRTAEFLEEKIGRTEADLTLQEWLTLPSFYLAEVTNGKVFLDNYGELTNIRQKLSTYPEAIRRKKLAGHLLLMGQAGQYNYGRCLSHGETGAAQLAVVEFVKHTMSACFLLAGVYESYYKWSFRALRALPKTNLALEAELLEFLLTTGNDRESAAEGEESLAASKQGVIETIALDIIEELQNQNLTQAICGDLEKHAYSVNDSIQEAEVRNLHILAGV